MRYLKLIHQPKKYLFATFVSISWRETICSRQRRQYETIT